MAFNVAEPQDTTKIRNLGVVIRPNWLSIQEADSTFRPYAINLQNRTPLVVANDPATIAATSIIYTKNDAAGNPETYNKDGSGNIVQMSFGGRMGGPSTGVSMVDFRFGSSTVTYNGNHINNAYAFTQANASSAQQGFSSVTRTGTLAEYTYVFSTPRLNANYCVVATDHQASLSSNFGVINVSSQSATQFVIRIVNSSGALINGGHIHSVMVCGGL